MTPRVRELDRLRSRDFDVLVVGGGMSGAVAAASLAARGASVALIERDDFASGTSQESSCLVWGGIKYLESGDFGLVADLCASRNLLLRDLPDHVREARFFSPHAPDFRYPAFFIRAAAWLYWWMGRRRTRRPRFHGARRMAAREPDLTPDMFDGAVEYSDGVLREHDAAFVLHFLRLAKRRGAVVVNRAEMLDADRGEDGRWVVRVRDTVDGASLHVRTRVLLHAAGPWAEDAAERSGFATEHRVLYSKGIHLIVPRRTSSDRVLALFGDDGRLFFSLPFGPRTLLGTTDTRVDRPRPEVTPEDRAFLLKNINRRIRSGPPLTEADIIAERCGVRPLVVARGETGRGDWMKLSRRHVIEVRGKDKALTILGGKLTDCIPIGEEVADAVRAMGVFLPEPAGPWWVGDDRDARRAFRERIESHPRFAARPEAERLLWAERLWRRWESEAHLILEEAERDVSAAEELFPGAEFLRAEVRRFAEEGTCVTLEDFLRRRTRLALLFRREELAARPELFEAAVRLFGEEAERKWRNYFRADPPPASSTRS